MYSGENSGSTNNRSVSNKDTLHITPHIAAHKSNSCSQPNGQTNIESNTTQKQDETTSRLAPIHTFAGHMSGYRVGIPSAPVFPESFQHNIRNQSAHLQVPAILTLPQSKALPQDLSAHASKLAVTEANNDPSQKTLPHIHSVSGQGIDNLATSLLVPVSNRCPAYYRLSDGTTISISSQHSPMLMSSQSDDSSNAQHSHMNSVRQNQQNETHSTTNTSISASMPIGTFSGSATNVTTSHQHGSNVSGLPDSHVYILPHELPGSNFLAPEQIVQEREVIRNPLTEEIKQEITEQEDLVHQALQAAVQNNKSGSGQANIDYEYGTENMGGKV